MVFFVYLLLVGSTNLVNFFQTIGCFHYVLVVGCVVRFHNLVVANNCAISKQGATVAKGAFAKCGRPTIGKVVF